MVWSAWLSYTLHVYGSAALDVLAIKRSQFRPFRLLKAPKTLLTGKRSNAGPAKLRFAVLSGSLSLLEEGALENYRELQKRVGLATLDP